MGHNDPASGITPAPRPVPVAEGPTWVRYQVLAAACSLAVLTYVHRLGFTVGTTDIKTSLGLNDQQVGYLAAAFLIAYGAFQVPGGLLGDRFGGRTLLTLLVLGWSLLTGAVALTVLLPPGWMPFAFLLAVRFLFGAFQAGGFPVLARVLADWMPRQERGFAQGMVWTFSRLGGALVPFLFLWLFVVFGGWATPFWLIAALGLLWCAAFWPWFRNRPDEMKQVNAAERELITSGRPVTAVTAIPLSLTGVNRTGRQWDLKRGTSASTDFKAETTSVAASEPSEGDLADVVPPLATCRAGASDPPSPPPPLPLSRFLGSRNVWGLCLMYGFVGFSGNFITSLLPDYLRSHRKLSQEATAWLAGLPLAFGIVSCLLGGVLSDWLIRRSGDRKWGRRLVGCVSLVLAGLAVLCTLWAYEVWVLAALFSAMFFFSDANMGPSWAACADVGERYAGTLSGAMNMIGAFFGAAGMFFAGIFFHRGWDVWVFVVFACSYGLASLCWLAIDVTKPLVPLRTDN